MRLALVVVALTAVPMVAVADSPRDEARQHFEAGKRAFDAGRYDEALVEFHEAYALAPYPQLLYNLARCHEELHHARLAVEAYDRYLAVNPGDAEARARADELRAAAAAEPPPPMVIAPSAPPSKLPPLAVSVAAPAPKKPLYKKWWLWTAVSGTVVVAVAVGLGVGLTRPPAPHLFPPLGAQ